MTEDRYRNKLAAGRIQPADLAAVLGDDLGEHGQASICGLANRFELRQAMLAHPLRIGPTEELRWFVAETDSLSRLRGEAPEGVRERYITETRNWIMRERCLRFAPGEAQPQITRDPRDRQVVADLVARFAGEDIDNWSDAEWEKMSLHALWRVCRDGVEDVATFAPGSLAALRHRDYLLEATGQDSDALVHDVLIRFCAAFTDQGLAHWHLPHRDQGFYQAFTALYREPGGPPDLWLQGLSAELERIDAAGMTPLDSILESLELLGVVEDEWDDFVPATLLALRGWAGMIHQMAVRSDRVARSAPADSLVEFLAVRMILERLALAHVARDTMQFEGSLSWLRAAIHAQQGEQNGLGPEQRAFLIFQLAQVLGWTAPQLHRLSDEQWSTLVGEVESFSALERRRIFHQAFERRFRNQALDALSVFTERRPERVQNPRLQAVFCIDTREESFRRHLEELSPQCETFGAAGFFCVPIYYRGVADAHFAALCPIVVRPQHWLIEEVVYSLEESHRRRAATRRALATASHQFHVGSRGITSGALLTAGVGVLASIPLVARVLFPRATARIRRTASSFVQPPQVTRLRMERTAAQPGPEDDAVGFTVDEMANFGERVLRDIGLTSNFARLVMFFGHGSFCLNNPHKSAYDCGACSGGAGGPNARALAAMLNDPRVRGLLSDRGLEIPAETWFLGGLHNTCDDSVQFFDLDLLPKALIPDFESARELLGMACQRNAHERCRRFDSAPLNLSYAAAHRHVEGRSEDLAQTRPEFGNCTNAMCFVGRRERVRGLYLDRRSFLHSYDPTQDDHDSSILARILSAVVVVCSGINLQYFFSYIDTTGWGSGTKLPHNITSLLGVMDGPSSDLRCGLPWQGVEIHEPMRLLLVIESTPEAMQRIMARNEVIGRILRNGWSQLALLDPHSAEILQFRNGAFHPYRPESRRLPSAGSSLQWYRNLREHLGFASIDGCRVTQPAPGLASTTAAELTCSTTSC